MNLQALRQKHAGLCDRQLELVNAAIDAARGLTPEETSQYQALQGEIDSLAATITAAEAAIARDTDLNKPAGQVHRPDAGTGADDQPKRLWNSFGEQLRAVRTAATPGGSLDPRLVVRAASGMSEAVPSDGGFLVQEDFSQELLMRVYQTGILSGRCRKIPISNSANAMKINGIDEQSRANGARWGGIQAYWEGEADALAGSKPKFRKMELVLKKLTGLCYATDELLEDAGALEEVIKQGFAEEFGFKVDDAIINGTGAGMPLGIMGSPCLVSVTKEANQVATSIVVQNIVKMWSRMWGRSRANAVWLINQDIEPQLYTMSLAVGTGGIPVYMPAGGVSGSPYSTLFGRPVIPIEQAQTLGTKGDIMLADLSQYLLTDKKPGINGAVSIHVRFLYDESVFRFIYRCDGQPIWHTPLTPFKGANTQSPFIVLDTRS